MFSLEDGSARRGRLIRQSPRRGGGGEPGSNLGCLTLSVPAGSGLSGNSGLPWPLHKAHSAGGAECPQDYQQGKKTEHHQPETGWQSLCASCGVQIADSAVVLLLKPHPKHSDALGAMCQHQATWAVFMQQSELHRYAATFLLDHALLPAPPAPCLCAWRGVILANLPPSVPLHRLKGLWMWSGHKWGKGAVLHCG